jgi:uncharacterized membrane protein YkoI
VPLSFRPPDLSQVVSREAPDCVSGQSACGGRKTGNAWKRGRRQPQAYAAGSATLCGGRDLPALLDVRSRAVGKRAIHTHEGWDLRPTLVGVVTVAVAIGCRAAVLGLATTSTEARAADADVRLKPICLNAAETREAVKAHKLLEPFVALKTAAAQRKAEALSARLCYSNDEFIYEITLLHHDGHLAHVEIEADSGKLISHAAHEAREPPK